MSHLLQRNLLGIPVIVWVFQLLYVALAIGLLIALKAAFNNQAPQILIQVLYVIAIIIINVVWRLVLKRIGQTGFKFVQQPQPSSAEDS